MESRGAGSHGHHAGPQVPWPWLAGQIHGLVVLRGIITGVSVWIGSRCSELLASEKALHPAASIARTPAGTYRTLLHLTTGGRHAPAINNEIVAWSESRRSDVDRCLMLVDGFDIASSARS